MKKNGRALLKVCRYVAALTALVLTTVHCGATGAPPVSIPAPVVTKITISTPDNGISTITGEAGAVTGGNTVRAINLTQEGIATLSPSKGWWEPLFWRIAHAQTTNETTAAADGSFTLDIQAAIGDRIRILQLDADNNAGTPIVLTVPFTPLALAYAPTGMTVDSASGQAFLIGNDGAGGVMTPVTLGANPALGTTVSLPAGCSNPTDVAYDSINDRLVVVANDTGAVCAVPLDGSAASVLIFLTVNPVKIAIHAGAARAAITNNTADALVEVSILDLNADAFAPVNLVNPAGGLNQASTPVVMTATDGATDYAVVVVRYSNGEHYAFVIDVNGPLVIGAGVPLDITSAEDIAGFNNTNAVLVDGGALAHILDINTTTGVVAVTNSVDVGIDPRGVTVDAVDNRAFVTNNSDNNLSVLDLTPGSETVTNILDLGTGPTAIVLDTTNDQLAVIHNGEQIAIVFGNLP